MQKETILIRQIETIEANLFSAVSGVLALPREEEGIKQTSRTFLYHDKNIYIFFDDDDEQYEKIKFGFPVSFTVSKEHKKEGKGYSFFSVSITGPIKKVEEQKLVEDIKMKYINKYSGNNGGETGTDDLNRLLIIDTEEINAFEETGG